MLKTHINNQAHQVTVNDLIPEYLRVMELDHYLSKIEALGFTSQVWEYQAFQTLYGDKEVVKPYMIPSVLRPELDQLKLELSISIFYYSLEIKDRKDKSSYVALRDNMFKNKLQSLVMDCHNDEMPNDWRYEMVDDIVTHLYYEIVEHNNIDCVDDARDSISDQVDSSTDIYNTDLLKWLQGDLRRESFIDDGLKPDSSDIYNIIQARQYEEIDFIAHTILNAFDDYFDMF